MNQTAPPCSIVIFGAAGDLTLRLLMPSIYNLAASGLLDPAIAIVGADHNRRDAASWRKELDEALRGSQEHVDENAWRFVADRLDYVTFDFTSDADYDALAKRFAQTGNVIFYLAVSPRFFETIATGLARVGLLKETPHAFRRLVVEKPFGRDLASARQLNALLVSLAAETQIYRIDHFLGKEPVQGIPALRFGSRMLEPLLRAEQVEHVQITAAETVGIEERGAFYETTGALRDMVPNHLFSLLTLVAMDAPASAEAEPMRDAKGSLLRSLRPLAPADVVRGQYAAGTLEAKPVKAYRDEDNVARDSTTETYVALRCFVDNDRWRDVPFYLRTGKRMAAHVTTIALTLRAPSGPLASDGTTPHTIFLGIDPQRGLVQRFAAKRPGVDLLLGSVKTGFRYEAAFTEPPNIGYETLLYDVMRGHALLFQRDDMIEAEWTAVGAVLDASGEPHFYAPGSAGPGEADALLAQRHHHWLDVEPLDAL